MLLDVEDSRNGAVEITSRTDGEKKVSVMVDHWVPPLPCIIPWVPQFICLGLPLCS